MRAIMMHMHTICFSFAVLLREYCSLPELRFTRIHAIAKTRAQGSGSFRFPFRPFFRSRSARRAYREDT